MLAMQFLPLLAPLHHDLHALPGLGRPRPLSHMARPSVGRSPAAPIMSGDDGKDDPISDWGPSDESALREFIASRGPGMARHGKPDTVMENLDSAWVLIFNAGQEDEGVYTLQGRAQRAAGYVLGFERDDDADRFATLLQAEGFDLATPRLWDADRLATFCDAGEFELSLVPQSALIVPPANNEYDKEGFERLKEPRVDTSNEDAERRFPGDGTDNVDAFATERRRLDAVLEEDAEGCSVEEGCAFDNNPDAEDDAKQ